MKFPRGRENLNKYQNLDIVLDWDQLLSGKGQLGQAVAAEHSWGKMLGWAWMLLFAVGVLAILLSGNLRGFNPFWPDHLGEILLWVAAMVYAASAYLSRDQITAEYVPETSLQKLATSGVTEIDVARQLSDALWIAIDQIYFRAYESFVTELARQVLSEATAVSLLARLGVDPMQLLAKFESKLHGHPQDFQSNYKGLFSVALIQGIENLQNKIDFTTLFFVFAKTWWAQSLTELNVTKAEVAALERWQRNELQKDEYERVWARMSLLKPVGTMNRTFTARSTPTLETFGRDLTREAAQGNFSLTIGREQLVTDMLKVLQKDHNPAVVMIGEPGVGKSRVLLHLAVRMVVEDVPAALRDKRLVVFNLNKAFTEARTVEGFKIILQDLLAEVATAGNIVLVFEEFDQILEIREDLKAEVVNVIQNGITKTGIKVVATTTTDGYQRLVKPLKQLAAVFESVVVAEPDAQTSLQILVDSAPALERDQGVKIQVGALRLIVQLAPRFAYERVMPDKGIDLLEESMIVAREQGSKYLTEDIVSAVVSKKLGVQVGTLNEGESEILLNLENKMHDRVVGQDTAIRAVAAALRRNRAGLSKAKRPIASFLFFGPTGVGKTEVAKALAATYYGDEKLMVRLDMSEFQEERNVQRLIGEMNGSEFNGGLLTEPVRSRPFSLVLLDEIEKANPKVLDLFLQVLDEGNLTDGAGRKVNFENTIIIATSNAGSREIADLIGHDKGYDEVYHQVLPVLKQVFRVEFLNRFDKVVMFKPLLPLELAKICELQLGKLREQLLEQGVDFEWGASLVDQLVQAAYNPVFGARELSRVIQEQVADEIAEKLIKGEVSSGGKITL